MTSTPVPAKTEPDATLTQETGTGEDAATVEAGPDGGADAGPDGAAVVDAGPGDASDAATE